jgi:hypothetical protein
VNGLWITPSFSIDRSPEKIHRSIMARGSTYVSRHDIPIAKEKKSKKAFRMRTETDDLPPHRPHIKNKGIQKRESTTSATHLAKKSFYPCMAF